MPIPAAERRPGRAFTRWVHRRLLAEYEAPEWSCRNTPLDELIGTVLSQHTSDLNADRAFAGLRAAFPTWEAARDAPPGALEAAIKSGGLAVVKAARIRAILSDLSQPDGRVALPNLQRLGPKRARELLMGLPGVGRKTASCVLLFGAAMPAIPVDTHVHRVVLRLGIVPPRTNPDQACDALERDIPKAQQFAFHVNLIRHGREVCKALRPRCDACVLQARCAYAAAAIQGKRLH